MQFPMNVGHILHRFCRAMLCKRGLCRHGARVLHIVVAAPLVRVGRMCLAEGLVSICPCHFLVG